MAAARRLMEPSSAGATGSEEEARQQQWEALDLLLSQSKSKRRSHIYPTQIELTCLHNWEWRVTDAYIFKEIPPLSKRGREYRRLLASIAREAANRWRIPFNWTIVVTDDVHASSDPREHADVIFLDDRGIPVNGFFSRPYVSVRTRDRVTKAKLSQPQQKARRQGLEAARAAMGPQAALPLSTEELEVRQVRRDRWLNLERLLREHGRTRLSHIYPDSETVERLSACSWTVEPLSQHDS
ncbi:unnamed protein product [Sympodiomycopsis kandeliae]